MFTGFGLDVFQASQLDITLMQFKGGNQSILQEQIKHNIMVWWLTANKKSDF